MLLLPNCFPSSSDAAPNQAADLGAHRTANGSSPIGAEVTNSLSSSTTGARTRSTLRAHYRCRRCHQRHSKMVPPPLLPTQVPEPWTVEYMGQPSRCSLLRLATLVTSHDTSKKRSTPEPLEPALVTTLPLELPQPLRKTRIRPDTVEGTEERLGSTPSAAVETGRITSVLVTGVLTTWPSVHRKVLPSTGCVVTITRLEKPTAL